jgi:peptide/nickel transport system permease protein
MTSPAAAVLLSEEDEIPPRQTGWRWLLRQLARKHAARIGGAIVAVIVVCAIFAPVLVPHDPLAVDAAIRLARPSANYWLGTDELGRDLFSRILYGTRYFALICMISVSIAASGGVLLGLIAGAGSFVADMVIMRLMDIMLAFPFILLILAVVAILGPSLWTAMIAVGIAGIPAYARLVRGEVLAVKHEEYVEAMRALGAGPMRIMFRTVLPNVVSQIVVYTSYVMPIAVLATAALSFLGLGAQPPLPEWGAMVVGSRGFLRTAWWVATAPGLAIFLAIFACNLLGNALRDLLDPRST